MFILNARCPRFIEEYNCFSTPRSICRSTFHFFLKKACASGCIQLLPLLMFISFESSGYLLVKLLECLQSWCRLFHQLRAGWRIALILADKHVFPRRSMPCLLTRLENRVSRALLRPRGFRLEQAYVPPFFKQIKKMCEEARSTGSRWTE